MAEQQRMLVLRHPELYLRNRERVQSESAKRACSHWRWVREWACNRWQWMPEAASTPSPPAVGSSLIYLFESLLEFVLKLLPFVADQVKVIASAVWTTKAGAGSWTEHLSSKVNYFTPQDYHNKILIKSIFFVKAQNRNFQIAILITKTSLSNNYGVNKSGSGGVPFSKCVAFLLPRIQTYIQDKTQRSIS